MLSDAGNEKVPTWVQIVNALTADTREMRAAPRSFASGSWVVFLIAGGEGGGVGLRLLADGDEVAVWRGRNTERFKRILHPLADVAGKRLQLELFDDETGG